MLRIREKFATTSTNLVVGATKKTKKKKKK